MMEEKAIVGNRGDLPGSAGLDDATERVDRGLTMFPA
jgi:hypothetical protein